jgi:CheY-like chemotaxis protein
MSQFSQASILVADPDAESLLRIASILIGENHRVVTAKDAVTAIALAQHETLDLLITDIRLGRWSGLELITTVRMDPEKRDLPVMFVSAHQTPGVIRRSYDSGDAFHVKKPIDSQVLTELVEKALWLPHLVKNHLEQNHLEQNHLEQNHLEQNHLEQNHLEQKSVKQPHFPAAPAPVAGPFAIGSIFSGAPVPY